MTRDELIGQLSAVVGEDHVLQRAEEMAPHLTDWRGRYQGAARCLVRPASTAEVAGVVRVCAAAGVPIVPQGGNTSLCGGFNANVIRHLVDLLAEYKPLGLENILVFPVGKKVADAVRKLGFRIEGDFQHMADKPSYQEAADLAADLMKRFLHGDVDKVELLYNHFKSTASQILTRETYLPIDLNNEKKEEERTIDYILEPSAEELMQEMLPKVLRMKMFTVLLDSNAAEHAARTMAMQIATDNANELLQELTVMYNKSRQQSITNELLDIVGGSMA